MIKDNIQKEYTQDERHQSDSPFKRRANGPNTSRHCISIKMQSYITGSSLVMKWVKILKCPYGVMDSITAF